MAILVIHNLNKLFCLHSFMQCWESLQLSKKFLRRPFMILVWGLGTLRASTLHNIGEKIRPRQFSVSLHIPRGFVFWNSELNRTEILWCAASMEWFSPIILHGHHWCYVILCYIYNIFTKYWCLISKYQFNETWLKNNNLRFRIVNCSKWF